MNKCSILLHAYAVKKINTTSSIAYTQHTHGTPMNIYIYIYIYVTVKKRNQSISVIQIISYTNMALAYEKNEFIAS